MLKQAERDEILETADEALSMAQSAVLMQHAMIFNTMRILKKVNPGDCYLENYLGHYAKHGEDFYDTYMLLWEIGAVQKPKRILEIGTRTGISICHLLSAYIDHSKIEKVVCVDPFDDGYTSPALVRKNLQYLNLPVDKVKIITGKSEIVVPSMIENGETYDYILVDGDHSKPAAKNDLNNAHILLEDGGIIVFDDISDAPGECALIDVWNDFKSVHPEDYFFQENMIGKGVAYAIKKEKDFDASVEADENN